MSDDKIKITSDGTGSGTIVTYKGHVLPIQSFSIECVGYDHLVTLKMLADWVDIDMEVFEDNTELMIQMITPGETTNE